VFDIEHNIIGVIVITIDEVMLAHGWVFQLSTKELGTSALRPF